MGRHHLRRQVGSHHSVCGSADEVFWLETRPAPLEYRLLLSDPTLPVEFEHEACFKGTGRWQVSEWGSE